MSESVLLKCRCDMCLLQEAQQAMVEEESYEHTF